MSMICRILILLVLFSLCFPLPAAPGTYEVGVGRTFANIGDVPWVLTPSALALNLFGLQTPLPEPHGQEILVYFPAHSRGLLQHEFS